MGAMDACARGLKAAAAMLQDGGLEAARHERYAGWDSPEAQAMLLGDLSTIAQHVRGAGITPETRSGRQERLENLVDRFL